VACYVLALVIDLGDMTEYNALSVTVSVLRKQLLLVLLALLHSHVSVHVALEFLQNFTLAIFFVVLQRIHHHVHTVALVFNFARSNEVRTNRVLFGKISCEVHLLPFEYLAQIICSRKTKLSQVPTFDEVYLSVARLLVNILRVAHCRDADFLREQFEISAVVSKNESILLSIHPALPKWELKAPCL
jgi:hypothetical protein